MAPVENSLAGSIHPVWDLLALYAPAIAGEIYYHVRHCLIGPPGARRYRTIAGNAFGSGPSFGPPNPPCPSMP